MSWDARALPTVAAETLSTAVGRLLARQVDSWPLLQAGVENLGRARSRELSIEGFRVSVRHIPHRIHSTRAETDAGALRARPCFLCESNLPSAQLGVRFNEEYWLLCNPFPILENHLTVVRQDHLPQRLAGELPFMLKLARALPGYMVLYNGSECGASAPDHLHFQACRPAVPLIDDLKLAAGGVIPGYPRSALVLKSLEEPLIEQALGRLLELLHAIDPARLEPMVNLVAFYDDGWTVVVFPRVQHRPQAFYTGELTWSPGAIDLCGVVVLPVEGDFERVTPEMIESGFSEVSLAPAVLGQVAEAMESE